jgi:hypothetical protein
MRNLIISFAIAVAMTSLFTAMLGAQVGIVASAARRSAGAPLVDVAPPIRAQLSAGHGAPGADHPAT